MKSSEFINEARTAATAWVILHTANKLILGKRAPSTNNPNLWNFFGGHIDAGESPAVAAARELAEETGAQINPAALKLISQIGDAFYFSALLPNAGALSTTQEISAIKAYKLTDLPNNLHSKTQNFFDRLDHFLK